MEPARLRSGVPHLDGLMGGGLPEGDVLLVFGPPGSGKTTLSFQTAFDAASRGKNVVYVSTLSEPPARLVKHLRGYSFFNEALLGSRLFLLSVYPVARQGVDKLVEALVHTVKAHGAYLLVIDGLGTLRDLHPDAPELRTFVSDLALALGPLQCSALITNSTVPDLHGTTSMEFTMCDAIIELGQRDAGLNARRSLRVWKVRGAPNVLGEHAVRIDRMGMAVIPRLETTAAFTPRHIPDEVRLPSGLAELDTMMGGGLPQGSVTIVAGAPGTGKTQAALQFLHAGLTRGEKGVWLGFREPREQLARRLRGTGFDLGAAIDTGALGLVRCLPGELEADAVLGTLLAELDRLGARRVAIDSVSELDHTIAEPRRRASILAALVDQLRDRGVTCVFTRALGQAIGPELDFSDSPYEVLAENVILMRNVEFRGELRRILSILKMRDTAHDHSIRQYEISEWGMKVLPTSETAQGLLRGIAELGSEARVKRAPTRDTT